MNSRVKTNSIAKRETGEAKTQEPFEAIGFDALIFETAENG